MTPCFSQEIIEDCIVVLKRLGLKDKNELRLLMKLFAEGYNFIFASKTPDICVVEDDSDDNKFIEWVVVFDGIITISVDNHLK